MKNIVLDQKSTNKAENWKYGRTGLKLRKNNFFKIWAACRCEISYEAAKLRNFNTLKVYGLFSLSSRQIYFILTGFVGNDPTFILAEFEEDSPRFLFDFEAFLRSTSYGACLQRAPLEETKWRHITPKIFVMIFEVSIYNMPENEIIPTVRLWERGANF